jgi:hypothetical protein
MEEFFPPRSSPSPAGFLEESSFCRRAAQFLPEFSRAQTAAVSLPIQRIIVACQENRSFDTYFGYYANAGAFGVPPGYTQPNGSGGIVARHSTSPHIPLRTLITNGPTFITSGIAAGWTASIRPAVSTAWATTSSRTCRSITLWRGTSRFTVTTSAACSGLPAPTGFTFAPALRGAIPSK